MAWLLVFIILIGGAGYAVYAALKPPSWKASERGNPTTTFHGKRITVFPSSSGKLWKFCIADPLDRAAPIYSEWYSSPETARAEAVSLMTTGQLSAKTHREQRDDALRSEAPDILNRAIKKQEEIKKAIAHLDRLKAPSPEQFDKVSKRLSAAIHATQHYHHTLIGCDADEETTRKAGEIPLAIIDLKASLAEVRSRKLTPNSAQ